MGRGREATHASPRPRKRTRTSTAAANVHCDVIDLDPASPACADTVLAIHAPPPTPPPPPPSHTLAATTTPSSFSLSTPHHPDHPLPPNDDNKVITNLPHTYPTHHGKDDGTAILHHYPDDHQQQHDPEEDNDVNNEEDEVDEHEEDQTPTTPVPAALTTLVVGEQPCPTTGNTAPCSDAKGVEKPITFQAVPYDNRNSPTQDPAVSLLPLPSADHPVVIHAGDDHLWHTSESRSRMLPPDSSTSNMDLASCHEGGVIPSGSADPISVSQRNDNYAEPAVEVVRQSGTHLPAPSFQTLVQIAENNKADRLDLPLVGRPLDDHPGNKLNIGSAINNTSFQNASSICYPGENAPIVGEVSTGRPFESFLPRTADSISGEMTHLRVNLAEGERVMCSDLSGTVVEAVIVALDPEPPADPTRAYVHFVGLDRRLDRWVPIPELQPPPPQQIDSKDQPPAKFGSDAEIAKNSAFGSSRSRTSKRTPSGQPKVTRSRRRALEELNPVSEKEIGNEVLARLEQAREEHTKIRNIDVIVFGAYEVDVWYFSPYPAEFCRSKCLYICDFCLKYMRSPRLYEEHCKVCDWVQPPGTIIYSDPVNKVVVHEVDGLVNAPYCQRLCLLGKLFLDHKTLYFDVAPFLFYVVLLDKELAGFFSKEKPLVGSEFNLACIVTLPQHQRKGVGRFLISLSYELTKREGKTGSPERPLSDLGQLSYRSYWMHATMSFIRSKRVAVGISAKDVASATGIRVSDIVATLKSLSLLTIWKGETYVDANVKSLDQAQRRVSNPRLPFFSSHLKIGTFRKQDRAPSAVPAGTVYPSGSPSAPSVKLRNRRNRRQSSRSSPSNVSSLCPREAPLSGSLPQQPSANGPGTSGAFSDNELLAMKEFVLLHGAEKVHAPLNTERGLKSADVHALAESLNMTMERCRKKLKRMSAAAIADPNMAMVCSDAPVIVAAPSLSGTASECVFAKPENSQGCGTSAAHMPLMITHSPGDPRVIPARNDSDMPKVMSSGCSDPGGGNGMTIAHTPESLTDAVDGAVTPAASPDIDFDRSVQNLTSVGEVNGLPNNIPALHLELPKSHSVSVHADSDA